MKNYLYLFLLLLGGVVVSCGSGDDAVDDKPTPVTPDKGGSWTVNMMAGMTRGLAVQDKGESSEKLVSTWETDELIAVYYEDQKVGYLKPSSKSTDVSVEIALTGNLDTPSTPYIRGQYLYFYYLQDKGFSAPDYTTQDGTLSSLVKNYHYATASAQILNVDDATHTLTIATASFRNPNKDKQAIIRLDFNASNKSNSQLTQVSNLTISSPALTSPITITPTSAASEIYVAIPATGLSATFTFCETVSNNRKYYDKLTATLANGKYYRANIYLHEGVQLVENGPIWATMNVGATSETDAGWYFAWGGTTGYANNEHDFGSGNAPYYNGSAYTKYTSSDGKVTLESGDDPVKQNWHGSWRMPTYDEFKVFSTNDNGGDNNYTRVWTNKNGKMGRTISYTGAGSTGESLFINAGGFIGNGSTVANGNAAGYYWTSSRNPGAEESGHSIGIYDDSGTNQPVYATSFFRYAGFSVRGILPY